MVPFRNHYTNVAQGSYTPRMRWPIVVVTVLLTVAVGRASDVELSGVEGHPRDRFPLTVHLGAASDPALTAAMKRAVSDWNALTESTLGLRVFSEVATAGSAQVLVAFAAADSGRMMGATRVEVDARGVIDVPVRITVFPPAGRGQTSREVILYQIVAHELGHALGLPHTRDPRSLMCCIAGSIDFNDPVVRDAYIEARRHPDVRSAAAELREHYARFWKASP
jgi:hypothetical protein